jgi:hypothetical protein
LKQVRRSNYLLIAFIITFLLCACQKKIDQETLARIYVENIILEETFANNSEMMKKQKLELFNKYKTSQSEFESNLRELGNDQEKWSKFFKRVNELLEEFKRSGAIS